MVFLNLENTTLHAAKTLEETEVRKLHSFCFQKQQHNPRLTNKKQATIYKKGEYPPVPLHLTQGICFVADLSYAARWLAIYRFGLLQYSKTRVARDLKRESKR
uniref:Uncharacterized protein n=1 Tax=Romanomermis culicivorax TaxID=13658 RepID=A0A915JN94_ROMCU